jgi:hypothetical protein
MFGKKSIALALFLGLAAGTFLMTAAEKGSAFAAQELFPEALPDIKVTVEVCEDLGCSKPITGGTVSSSNGPTSHRTKWRLANLSTLKGAVFYYKLITKINGVTVNDPPGLWMTLGPGEVAEYWGKVDLPVGSTMVEATIIADPGNHVKEMSEANNQATRTYTAVVANPDTDSAVVADLAVQVHATKDPPPATSYIQNGETLSYSGGAPSNWVRFEISNKGKVAGKFTYKLVIRNNGVTVLDPPAKEYSLYPGASLKLGPIEVKLPATTNKIEASILADIGNLVKESNETNNHATLAYTAKVLK